MKKRIFFTALAAIVGYLGSFFLCGAALSVGAQEAASLPNLKVVVDAGHGGMDGGVVGKTTGRKESDLNLAIAYKIKEKLTDAGFETVMTRKTEGGLYDAPTKGFKTRDMQKRKEIVEKAAPTLVLSIHQNYYPSSRQRGGQTFYLKGNDGGQVLAENIQAGLNALYGEQSVKPRKSVAADFFMLRFSMPSVIVECGFLSSPKDEALLLDAVFEEKLAAAVVSGTVKYLQGLSV